MFKKNPYTCPDVLRYRKNQYRLMGASYVLSCLPALAFWAAVSTSLDKNETTVPEIPKLSNATARGAPEPSVGKLASLPRLLSNRR